jgi:hypothetical protein
MATKPAHSWRSAKGNRLWSKRTARGWSARSNLSAALGPRASPPGSRAAALVRVSPRSQTCAPLRAAAGVICLNQFERTASACLRSKPTLHYPCSTNMCANRDSKFVQHIPKAARSRLDDREATRLEPLRRAASFRNLLICPHIRSPATVARSTAVQHRDGVRTHLLQLLR